MGNYKRGMKPLFLKLGVALALSFAGYLYSQIRTKRISSPGTKRISSPGCKDGVIGGDSGCREELSARNPCDESTAPGKGEASQKVIDNTVGGYSPSIKKSGDKEGFLLPEFNKLMIKEFETGDISPKRDVETPTFKKTDKDEIAMEQEIISLRNMVRSLRERERNLEIQLLEYYGLKEQETAVMELQNRLKINSMEAKLFMLKIESLQAENRRLQTQLSDHSRVVSELEAARAKIKLLKRKIRSDAEHTRTQLSSLQHRITTLQDEEQAGKDVDVQEKIQRLKDLEDESAELKRENSRLQSEVSDLAMKLESTQILASSVLEVPGAEALEEANHLRQANDDLAKEVERLQEGRCTDAEELVYLKWVNACLRYELRNYQAPPGKTVARDLSKNLSPKSEEKAKQLILEYANSGDDNKGTSLLDIDSECCSSSQASTLTETGESDESSFDITSTVRSNSSSKTKFFSKLKRLVLRKDGHSSRLSSTDRTPTSCGNSDRRGSISMRSFDDMIGTYSYNSGSSFTPIEHAPDNQLVSETKSLCNLSAEAKNSEFKNRFTRSQSNLSSSFDIQRLRNPRIAEISERERQRRNSDLGSSLGYNKTVLGEGTAVDSLQGNGLEEDPNLREKLELIKFAEVLKSSRGTEKYHRRAVSFSYF